MKAYYTYEERIKNPHLGLINFTYLQSHPEAMFLLREKYLLDQSFRIAIIEKAATDKVFEKKINKIFPIKKN